MPDAPTWTVKINAPADKVWPLIADVGRHGEWSPKPYKMEWTAGEPNAVGSGFRSVGWLPNDKHHKMQGKVTVNEPMTRFEVVSSDDGTKATEWTNRYDVTSDGTTTTVVKTMAGPPTKGVGKVLFAIAFPLIVRPGVQKGMDMLKARSET
jgi:uncharacterized protein YndB with AHSA1/START domain